MASAPTFTADQIAAAAIAEAQARQGTSPIGTNSPNTGATGATNSTYSVGGYTSGVGIQAATAYTLQDTDYGGMVFFNTSSPVAVTLNGNVHQNFTTIILNQGTGAITLTPDSGYLVNGSASLTLQSGAGCIVAFANRAWYAYIGATFIPVVPATTPAILHEWLNSYNAVTGAFTQTQPASSDLSDAANIPLLNAANVFSLSGNKFVPNVLIAPVADAAAAVSPLTINANTAATLPTQGATSALSAYPADASGATETLWGFGSGTQNPALRFRMGGGTAASPTATAAGTQLGQVNFSGYDGATWQGSAAAITALALNTWSGSDRSTSLSFATTASGSTSQSTKMTLSSTGNLSVTGNANAASYLVGGSVGTSGQAIVSDGSTGGVWKTLTPADVSMARGNMNGYNVGLTVTIGSTGVFVIVPTGLSSGIVSGFTFTGGNTLVCNTAGTYMIVWSMSLEVAAANQEVEGTVMVNGTADTTMAAHCELTTTSRPQTISGSGIRVLAANDAVGLCLAEITAINNIRLQHLTMTLLRIA